MFLKNKCGIELNENIFSLNGVLKLEDYLFLHQKGTGQDQFKFLQGIEDLTESNINTFENNIFRNIAIAQKCNFKYLHVIFPAKAVVYRNLFGKYNVNIKSIVSNKHLISSVMYATSLPSHFEFDDTHHNNKGLYEIVKQIFTQLSLNFPSLTPIYNNISKKGDLGGMYGLPPHLVQILSGFKEHFEGVKIIKFSLFDYLPGNSGHIDYHLNGNSLIKQRLVLFGDSYFRESLDILSHIFEEVIYFRVPYIMEDIVKILEPDIVWTGNAERYLVDVPNAEKPIPYFLNYFNANFKPDQIPVEALKVFVLLFSGKSKPDFLKWKQRNLVTISRNKQLTPLEISIDDLKTETDINFCYHLAVSLEKKNLIFSYHLIKLALEARPNGQVIKDKYNCISLQVNAT